MKWIVAVMCIAFAFRTSGQTTAQPPPFPVVIEGWHYDPAEKTVTLHLVNRSSKTITAFSISMAVKYADGSTNPWYAEGIPHKLRDSQRMEDELNLFIRSEEGSRGHGIAVVAHPVVKALGQGHQRSACLLPEQHVIT